jgi:hypothetical protein
VDVDALRDRARRVAQHLGHVGGVETEIGHLGGEGVTRIVRGDLGAVCNAATQQPGADTEVMPGLTVRQAVGLDPVSQDSIVASTAVGSYICWSDFQYPPSVQ